MPVLSRSVSLLAMLALAVLAGCSAAARQTIERDYGPAPDFSLPNVAGGEWRLTTEATAHRTVVLTFVAADCREECPKVEGVLRGAAQRLARRHELGSRAEIVTVELDPQTNSLQAVRKLRERLWPRAGWAFLRGDAAQTASVLREYDVTVKPRKPGEDVVHSDFVYVINDRLRQVELLAPNVNLTSGKVISVIANAEEGRD